MVNVTENIPNMTKATDRPNEGLYILFLGLIAAVPALSTDMYLPAMPTIALQWGISEARVGLSLVLWFVSFSIFLLVYGPLSDKYGRRPILLAGLSVFTGASGTIKEAIEKYLAGKLESSSAPSVSSHFGLW